MGLFTLVKEDGRTRSIHADKHESALPRFSVPLLPDRVTAGMKAARARGKHLGPPIRRSVVTEIEALATSTNLSIRQIHERIDGNASRGIIGEISKRIRSG